MKGYPPMFCEHETSDEAGWGLGNCIVQQIGFEQPSCFHWGRGWGWRRRDLKANGFFIPYYKCSQISILSPLAIKYKTQCFLNPSFYPIADLCSNLIRATITNSFLAHASMVGITSKRQKARTN